VLQTEDFTRLDPGTQEHKFYAPATHKILMPAQVMPIPHLKATEFQATA